MGELMNPRRSAGAVFAALALLFVGFAAYLFAPSWTIGPSWKSTQGTVIRSTLAKTHDSVGRLLFQLRAEMQINVGNAPRVATVLSETPTHDFGRMVEKLQEFPPKSTHSVRYRTDNAAVVRFGSEFRSLNARKPLAALGVSLIFAVAALWMFVKRPHERCGDCGDSLKSYYKFCPRCSAPVEAAVASANAQ